METAGKSPILHHATCFNNSLEVWKQAVCVGEGEYFLGFNNSLEVWKLVRVAYTVLCTFKFQ